MGLISYQQTARRLLSDWGFVRFNDFDLRDWINIARKQAALEGEAVRALATLNTATGVNTYNFSAFTIPAGKGYSAVQAIRMLALPGALLSARPWEWLFEYYIAPAVGNGAPVDWAQLGQGSSGTFYLGPTPSAIQTMSADVVILPSDLATDSDIDALPYPWQDAVPYFAAYMALLTAQNEAGAQAMFQSYERFMMRARTITTPSSLAEQYPGAMGAKLAAAAVPLMPPASLGQATGTG